MSERTKALTEHKDAAGRKLLKAALGTDMEALFQAVADFRMAHGALQAETGKAKIDG